MSSPHRRPLRLGTRGSPLALAQAGRIARQLHEQCGRPAVLVTVATPGDESTAPIGFLAALDAGCIAPVGALAELATETGAEPAVRLSGVIAAPDGSSVIRAHTTGAAGDALGRQLAHRLLQHGGAALLDSTTRRTRSPDPRSHPHAAESGPASHPVRRRPKPGDARLLPVTRDCHAGSVGAGGLEIPPGHPTVVDPKHNQPGINPWLQLPPAASRHSTFPGDEELPEEVMQVPSRLRWRGWRRLCRPGRPPSAPGPPQASSHRSAGAAGHRR